MTGTVYFASGTAYYIDNAGCAKFNSLDTTGVTNLGSTLGVTGATTLSSTLTVTGATTLNSTLAVKGIATMYHVIPADDNTTYELGSATARWKKLHIGTADTYGGATQPIWWSDGKPAECTSYANAVVKSAGEFTSEQSITLTGDVTGTASSKAGWSIAATAWKLTPHEHDATYVAAVTAPTDYNGKLIFTGMKTNTTLGIISELTYSYVIGLRGYDNKDGGGSHEFAFNDNAIYHRMSSTGADTWGSWNMLVRSAAGSAVGSATQPVWINSAGIVTACTSYANASVNYANSAGAVAWANVTDKPATATRWPAWSEVTDKPATATRWPTWDEVTSKPSTFAPSSHVHYYLENTATNVSASAVTAALSAFWTANKTTLTRDHLIAFTSSHSGRAIHMGYFINGYDDSPYGGFFTAFYGTPYYSYASNGTFSTSELVRNDNRSYGISITGNAATATALTSNAGNVNTPIYFSGGKPVATNNKLGAVSDGSYWGMRGADNGDGWIRTTSSGIIPVQSGGAGSGHCGLGTSSWYFSYLYVDNSYAVHQRSSGRAYMGEWIEFSSAATGLYCPNGNGAHWYPNNVSSYGTWMMQGSRGGYSGIHLGNATTYMTIMGGTVNNGLYCEAKGRWIVYYNTTNDRISLNAANVNNNVNVAISGSCGATGEFISTTSQGFRLIHNNRAVFWHWNGSTPQFYLMFTDAGSPYGSWNSARPFYVNASTYYSYFTRAYNAVWNDYAEFRIGDTTEPGYCVTETTSGVMTKTTERLQAGAKVISDTYGTAMGETKTAKTPIAVSGRVLAYPYRDRTEYPLGAAVCAAPDGTVDLMTREEIMTYPERIVGTVSEIPDYEKWHCGGDVERGPADEVDVNGRIWIYVK